MPDVTRMTSPRRFLRFVVAPVVLAALPALGQTPTPTPTPTPTATPTPSVTPTPTPAPTARPVPAGSEIWTFAGAGTYDGSNLIKDSSGAIWAVSAAENAISRLSANRTKLSRWIMAKDSAPSSLLPDSDGTFWVTELGGFKVAHFDPASGNVTEYVDGTRRPTALVKRPDGKFWLPETGGLLALFDPSVPSFVYYQTPGVYYLSYPWQDADGTLFSLDFIYGTIVRWAPDLSTARVWTVPATSLSPSKIVRLADGKLWISFHNSSELGRFDDQTGTLDIFTLFTAASPFDIQNYRGLVLYSDLAGQVGFLDPAKVVPSSSTTLKQADVVPLVRSTLPTTAATSPLAFDEQDLIPPVPGFDVGSGLPGLAQILVNKGSALWAMLIDEVRGRIFFGTTGAIGILGPPPQIDVRDLYLASASAAALSSDPARAYRTQIVTWNRGTPDAAGATKALNSIQRILPDGWIAGLSGTSTTAVPAGTLLSQEDVVGTDMDSAGVFGGFQITSDVRDDAFAWSRVSLPAPGGGTLGYAANAVKDAVGLGAGDTGFLFASPDAAQRTIAGLLVTQSSTGTLSIVDASGVTKATYAYDWPGGYRVQGTSIFDAFALPPLPSARIVCKVATGRVLLFGTAVDPVSGDGANLGAIGAAAFAPGLQITGFERGGGLSSTLQVFNPGTNPAHVSLSVRVAQPVDGPTLPPAAFAATTTVPPGTVATLDLSGAGGAVTGTLDIVSDQPVAAFATFRTALPSGGNAVFTAPAVFFASPTGISPGSRGVFLAATQNDAFSSTIQITSTSPNPGDVTVRFSGADGTATGSRTVTVPPWGVVSLPGSLAGAATDLGRVDVVPADGTTPFLTVLLRQDRQTGDIDVILPLVIAK
jgi:streptogramin lyase